MDKGKKNDYKQNENVNKKIEITKKNPLPPKKILVLKNTIMK